MPFQVGVVCQWTNDGQRFLLEHFDTIQNYPSQIYHSALPFSPSSSWLHKCYHIELSTEVKIIKGLPTKWGACSRTVSLDSCARGLSFWNDTIVVGSECGNIITLDAITGSQTANFLGHTNEVNSLTFSPDGELLVSGSDDTTVKLWDVQTGGEIKTFYGHTQGVFSVSISEDCTRIASGSRDKTICLWNIQTGECCYVIEQEDTVYHVSFIPNTPQCLLSICNDKIWQQDINGHRIGPTYNGSCSAFSSDGTQFVSCNETTVTVRNSSSGVIAAECYLAQGDIYCCHLSPDNKLVAAAVKSTAYVWDITSSEPHLIETFTGHTDNITSLAFSSPSSLISTSWDKSIKLWQIGIPDHTEPDPKQTSSTLAEIKSITLQAKDNVIITSDSDGVVRTWDISTGICNSSFQTPAEDSHERDVQLIDGRLVIVWYANEKINIWDVEKGELFLAIDNPGDLDDLKISGDGSRVFTLDAESIQALSIQTGEIVGEVEIVGSEDFFGSLTVDGSRVWACLHYSDPEYQDFAHIEYQGWDFGIPGSLAIELPNTLPYKFHPDGVVLWDTNLCGIKDKITEKVIFQLPRRYGKPVDVQWNDQYLVACFHPIEALILDFSHIIPH